MQLNGCISLCEDEEAGSRFLASQFEDSEFEENSAQSCASPGVSGTPGIGPEMSMSALAWRRQLASPLQKIPLALADSAE
jgi:hypothetical protein